MAKTLYWIQGGGCGGDTWSFLGAEAPDLIELFELLDVELLWHPSLSDKSPEALEILIDRILRDEQPLDILCLEGAVIQGPSGTGMADTLRGKPKMGLIKALAHKASNVLAVGTCASFGGFGAGHVTEATGMQFHKWEFGGFLGKDFQSKNGRPV
ncbi:MAG: NADH:ubiquinone oxidoreductase, partial [Deltaproteobacteria bacterium]|nr:NADH:ubiquinone oxidoreductase [Deltaproteobacteria bacterium]